MVAVAITKSATYRQTVMAHEKVNRLLINQDIPEGQNTINLSELPPGMLIFVVRDQLFNVLKEQSMDQPKYKFTKSNELHFEFISQGRNGEVLKRVTFYELGDYGFFNMGLGDINAETGDVDYNSITDNGDRNAVLATVSEIVDVFFEIYPQHTIYFKGTTDSRTRLYQMAINHYYDELSEKFHILGELESKMTRFKKNTNFKSFLILKK